MKVKNSTYSNPQTLRLCMKRNISWSEVYFFRPRGQCEGSFSNCGIKGPGSSGGIQTHRGVWLGSADALLVKHKAAILWNTDQLWDKFREIKPPDLERAAADGGRNVSGILRGWYVEGKWRQDWGQKVKNKDVHMDKIFIYPDSRIVSPLSSDSGKGADYSGAAATSYRSPTEVKQACLLVNFLIRICLKSCKGVNIVAQYAVK